ncbi:MAG: DUF1508 domain-containing protein [Treponematales bacterium]
MATKFTVFFDKSKKYRYTLKDGAGKLVIASGAYETRAACLKDVRAIQKAKIADETAVKKPAAKKSGAKKTAGRKPAGRKAAARKPAARKTPGRRPAARRAPVRAPEQKVTL